MTTNGGVMTSEEFAAAEAQDATERRLGREADRLRVAVTSAATVLDGDDQQPAGRQMGDELRAAHEVCEASTLALIAELRAAREQIAEDCHSRGCRTNNTGGIYSGACDCALARTPGRKGR